MSYSSRRSASLAAAAAAAAADAAAASLLPALAPFEMSAEDAACLESFVTFSVARSEDVGELD